MSSLSVTFHHQQSALSCSDDEGEGMKLAHAHDPAGPWAKCAEMPEPVRRAAMATHAREQPGQTGVKGVLADYKAHKQEEQMQVFRKFCAVMRHFVFTKPHL